MAKKVLEYIVMSSSSPRLDIEITKIYNEIDAFLRKETRSDKNADHVYLIQEVSRNNKLVAKHQQDLRSFAQLRNIFVHNPFNAFADPIATPNAEIVKHYAKIRDSLINPPKALSIAIPAQKIFTANLQSNLVDVLEIMEKNIFTHVPIIEDGAMVGILSESVIVSYIATNKDSIITKDMLVSDLGNYTEFENIKSETFSFVARDALLADIYDLFNQAIKKHQRIGMVFITQHGKKEEKPLGIITAWDLASPDFIV